MARNWGFHAVWRNVRLDETRASGLHVHQSAKALELYGLRLPHSYIHLFVVLRGAVVNEPLVDLGNLARVAFEDSIPSLEPLSLVLPSMVTSPPFATSITMPEWPSPCPKSIINSEPGLTSPGSATALACVTRTTLGFVLALFQ